MNEVNSLQMIPLSIWAVAAATGIMIVLLAFLMYLFYRKRLQSIGPLNNDVGDLVNQKQQLEADIDSIKDWVANQKDELIKLESERKEQEIIRSEIQRLEQEMAKKEEDNKKLRDEVGSLENQRYLLVQSIDKVENEKSKMQKEVEKLTQDATDTRNVLQEVEKKLKKKHQDEKEILEEIDKANAKVQELQKESKSLEDDINNSQKLKNDLDQQIESSELEVAKMERVRKQKEDEISVLKNSKKEMDIRVQTLSDKLKTIGQMPKEAFDSLNQPVFNKSKYIKNESNEQGALEELHQLTTDSGFKLPERLQNAFHTSLKTADISCLTVMAGVSGTGKSAFPKLYAQSMGIHFLPLAVEPRWDSPHDLFGFLNYMENRYESNTLGRALVQFNNSPHSSDYANLNNQVLMVLLDEMNLARIEYYFSEFLSKLEMRRNVNIKNMDDYRMVSAEIYAGKEEDKNREIERSDPIFLYASSNVLFVGTMNEDETTQSLSDKVIDRANVLYFGKPEKLSNIRQQIDTSSTLAPISMDTWRSWIVEPKANTISEFDKIDLHINNLNSTLSEMGRPFGWRTYKAIMTYIANHPDVRLNGGSGLLPLADQVAMRIMPKLRGLDLSEYSDVFLRLGSQISEINNDALSEAFENAQRSSQGFFNWQGIMW